jgi:hypothetical protein
MFIRNGDGVIWYIAPANERNTPRCVFVGAAGMKLVDH